MEANQPQPQKLESSQQHQAPQDSMAVHTNNEGTSDVGVAEQDNNSLQNTTITELDEDKLDDTIKQRQIELEEEKKLKARHPCIQRPGSEFLQKRLQRGQKYFDSGDYNMAKASTNPNIKLPDADAPKPAIDSKILSKRH